MNKIELSCILGQIICCIDRRIAASHDDDNLILIEVSVAKFTVVDTLIIVTRGFWKRQLPAVHARCKYDGIRFIDCAFGLDNLRLCFEHNVLDFVKFIDHSTDVFRLVLKRADKLLPRNSHKARIVLNPRCVCNLPADKPIFENEHIKLCAPRIKCRRKPRHTCADDDNILVHSVFRHKNPHFLPHRLEHFYACE